MRVGVGVVRDRRKKMCLGIAELMDDLSAEETTALSLLAAAYCLYSERVEALAFRRSLQEACGTVYE